MLLFAPGTLFGRYRMEASLGRGGMGEVYRAFDTQLERTVAIKVLRRDKAPTEELVQRFSREARLGARLAHPNTVAVFDSGALEGIPFIAMEFVDGASLATRMMDSRVSIHRRIGWLVDAARGLAAAHALAILHRDMKPENVLVSSTDVAKVADFGLGKRHEITADLRKTYKTQLGFVVGTLLYMAPEQMDGEEIDARADQFSWGLMAYYVLSGVHPRYANPLLTKELPLLHRKVALVPENVGHAVARAMSVRMQDRFPSMMDLVAMLTGNLVSQPQAVIVPMAQVSAPPPLAPPASRRGPASSGKRAKQKEKHVIVPPAHPVGAPALLPRAPAASGVKAHGPGSGPRAGPPGSSPSSPIWRFHTRRVACPIAPIRYAAVGSDGRTALAVSERGLARFEGRWSQIDSLPEWLDPRKIRCITNTPDESFVCAGENGFLFRVDREAKFHRWDLGRHARVTFRGVTASEHRVDLAGALGERGVVATLDRGGARFIDADLPLTSAYRSGSLFVCGPRGTCGYVDEQAVVRFFERVPPDLNAVIASGSDVFAVGFGGWALNYSLEHRPELERVETTSQLSFLALEGAVPWAASERGRFLRREANAWKRKSPELDIDGGVVGFHVDKERLTAICGDGAIISATPQLTAK